MDKSHSDLSQGKLLPSLILFLILFGLGALSVISLSPPTALPADAPRDEFSAERALVHIQAIGQTPHPIGSEANTAVRQYIIDELTALGLDPQVQATTAVYPPYTVAADVKNVVARLSGTGGSQAILLVGHYDSVPTAPGANDDGAAVATLLETARALQAGPPLKNDVIFLFPDGEEVGLAGAQGFAQDHPWMQDVGLVLNFEARGDSGPVFCFETSPDNGWLIGEFAKAVPRPLANSLTYDIYQLLPNDTDFTVFKFFGLAGFNFGYIDGATSYHTALDNLENINLDGLQHHGSYALSLARHFGELETMDVRRSNAVYFDVFRRVLLTYPGTWVLPLMALTVLLYVALLAFGIRKQRLSLKGIVFGFLAFLLDLLAVAAAVWLVSWLLSRQYSWYQLMYYGLLYWWAFAALSVMITAALYIGFRRLVKRWLNYPPDDCVLNLAYGALAWWLILAIASSLFLVGGSFAFIWPLLFSLAGIGLLLWSPEQESSPWRQVTTLALFAVPGVILSVPLAYAVFIGLSIDMIIAPVIIFTLLIGLLIPHLELFARPSPWGLPIIAGLVFIGLLAIGVLNTGYEPTHPKPNMISYGLNADTGQARWIGFADPDEWTSQFLPPGQVGKEHIPEFFPNTQEEFPVSPAPTLELPAPQADLLEDHTDGNVRRLRLHITSPRGAAVIRVYIPSEDEVLAFIVAGKRIVETSEMAYWAPPPEGFDLTLEVKTSEPVKIILVDHSFGLPEIPGVSFNPRPDYMMPAPSDFADTVQVSKSYTFGQ